VAFDEGFGVFEIAQGRRGVRRHEGASGR